MSNLAEAYAMHLRDKYNIDVGHLKEDFAVPKEKGWDGLENLVNNMTEKVNNLTRWINTDVENAKKNIERLDKEREKYMKVVSGDLEKLQDAIYKNIAYHGDETNELIISQSTAKEIETLKEMKDINEHISGIMDDINNSARAKKIYSEGYVTDGELFRKISYYLGKMGVKKPKSATYENKKIFINEDKKIYVNAVSRILGSFGWIKNEYMHADKNK